jgi:hypothetical protein
MSVAIIVDIALWTCIQEVFGRISVIVTKVVCVIPQSLQANSDVLLQTGPPPPTSFPAYYSAVILPDPTAVSLR